MKKIVVCVLVSMLFLTGCPIPPIEVEDITYTDVNEIFFVDDMGEIIDGYEWDDIWDVVDNDASYAMNVAFSQRGWFGPGSDGDIYISSNYRGLTDKEFSLLMDLFDGLDRVHNEVRYNFEAEYNTDDDIIRISHTKSDALGFNTFYALQLGSNTQTNIKVTAKKCDVSIKDASVEIYLKEGQTMPQDKINYIAENFETMYQKMVDTYGAHTDYDKNKKIVILLYDVNQNFGSSVSYVAGFFNPLDLFALDATLNPFSNVGEILYVESRASDEIESVFSTVIHEFQHLINANTNLIYNISNYDRWVGSDLWINEALSESTEIFMLDAMSRSRLAGYNDTQHPYHNSIVNGNYFYTWNTDEFVLADYSTASLFMYWLYLNHGGSELYKRIATGGNRGSYQAVLDALNDNWSWERVMTDWLTANQNVSTGYPNGIYAYWDDEVKVERDLELISTVYSGSSKRVNLYPGDAVLTSKATTGVNGNLERINKDGLHITLNADTPRDYEESVAIGVTMQQSAVVSRSIQSNTPSMPDIDYRIIPYEQKPLDFDNLKAISE